MDCGTTHYAGCECHEKRHQEEIASLKAQVARLSDSLKRIDLICDCEGRPTSRHCWKMRDIAHAARFGEGEKS